MAPPRHAIESILEHAPLKAAERLPGVELHIDNPTERVEEFSGTDGIVDVYVFDAATQAVNIAQMREFSGDEDLFLFQNMEGRDLTVGNLGYWSNGDPVGFNFVLFHSNGASANLVVFDLPYDQAVVEEMVLLAGRH